MKKYFLLFIIIILFINSSCESQKVQDAQIAWDSWGVPHITADNIEDLFFAQGWAQMHNHANTILELYGNSRIL